MNIFSTILFYSEQLFGYPPILLTIISIFFTIQFILLLIILNSWYKKQLSYFPFTYLVSAIVGQMLSNFPWILHLSKILYSPNFNVQVYEFFRRLGWGAVTIQYISITLLLWYLCNPQKKHSFVLNIHKITSCCIVFYFICNATIKLFSPISSTALFPDLRLERAVSIYLLFFLLGPVIVECAIKLSKNKYPILLTKQLYHLIFALIIPYWISDLLQILPLYNLNADVTLNYTFVGISNLLFIAGISFCSKKTIRLRFLNLANRVQSSVKYNVINDFRDMLEQFSQVTTAIELQHVTQQFFKEVFKIPALNTRLYIRHNTEDHLSELKNQDMSTVEAFISTQGNNLLPLMKDSKIFVYDEVEFTHFYEPTADTFLILNFLQVIKADIFLPLYEKDRLIAYIVIDRYSRMHTVYSDVEYDEMLIFGRYLASMIHMLQSKPVEVLIERQKNLEEELYRKHQEINQYKESIRSFTRNAREHGFGIIFYKNRRFTFANQAAHELIPINPHEHVGHPLSRVLKRVVQQVQSFKAAQSIMVRDTQENNLMISGMPSLNPHEVIITVYYPQLTDVIKQQLDALPDPSIWDYLLYLETTKTGKLINKLLPSASETILPAKIALLKAALGKETVLLDVHADDLELIIDVLHQTSLRDTLHIFDTKQTHDHTSLLFGINPLFKSLAEQRPIMQTLHKIGTLYIPQIHLLQQTAQQHLAEYLQYGYYRPFKSDHRMHVEVRIICSTDQDLSYLVQSGQFDKGLYQQLQHRIIHIPSLLTLPAIELCILAQQLCKHIGTSSTVEQLVALSEREKEQLIRKRPASLKELKEYLHQLLHARVKITPYEPTKVSSDITLEDSEINKIAQLGKLALKEPKLLTKLWQRFQNQNKIATLLGVNRSTITRRFRRYGLIPQHQEEADA